MQRADVVVIGGGAMGTAAAMHLAQRGRQVIVLERFAIGHGRGSSGGPTRIFRLTYADLLYVRMAVRAIDAWRELENWAGEQLLRTTGGLVIGPDARAWAHETASAGAMTSIMSPAEAVDRWPLLRIEPGTDVVFQPDAGVLRATTTVSAQARVARAAGAEIREDVRVARIVASADEVRVVIDDDEVRAGVAIVTCGPWAGPLLRAAGIDLALTPTLEQVHYFGVADTASLPTLIELAPDTTTHHRFAVPDPWAPGSLKLGLHGAGPPADPDEPAMATLPDLTDPLASFADERFIGVRSEGWTETCFYTNTPDEDFIIDRVGALVIGSPCSGHGFKFTPLIGSLLADLATGVDPPVDLARFRSDRPALRVRT